MIRNLFAGLLLFSCLSASAQNDVIILRDGREKHVKLTQVGRRQTFYKAKDDRKADEESISNDEIYLLKYETRGNAYFDDSGQLMTATTEPVAIPDDACTIYTLDRREIPAWNVAILGSMVTFSAERPPRKRKGKDYRFPRAEAVRKVDVFFILYPDGTRDVINDSAKSAQSAAAPAMQQSDSIASGQPDDSEQTMPTTSQGREYPCRATITTKMKVKMQVFIYDEDSSTVSYRKIKSEKASVFKISRKNIARINYQ